MYCFVVLFFFRLRNCYLFYSVAVFCHYIVMTQARACKYNHAHSNAHITHSHAQSRTCTYFLYVGVTRLAIVDVKQIACRC